MGKRKVNSDEEPLIDALNETGAALLDVEQLLEIMRDVDDPLQLDALLTSVQARVQNAVDGHTKCFETLRGKEVLALPARVAD